MVRAAEPLLLEQGIRVAHEVAVGKEEQPHDVEGQIAAKRIYVSLVDIYFGW